MRRRVLSSAGATLAVVVLAGCGVTTQDAKQAVVHVRTSTAATSSPATFPTLANRPPGQLILAGSISQLSSRAYADYREQGGSATVKLRNNTDAKAFSELCSGKVDVVDSATAITQAELKRCTSHRVRPIELEFGSQAVVLAIRQGTDTGADCLNLAQVRTMVRSGSPATSWSSLGYDDLPLNVAGTGLGSPVLDYLSSYVLGEQQQALLDFRYDYAAQHSDDGTLNFVIGTPAEQAASTSRAANINRLRTTRQILAGQRITLKSATKWVAQAEKQVTTGIDDGWPYDERLLNESKLQAAETKQTNAQKRVAKLSREIKTLGATIKHERTLISRRNATAGNVGVFPYGFYSLYQQQLRAIEISSTRNPQNCVFPSSETVATGAYPLARQMLLTTTLNELDQNTVLREFLLSYLQNSTRLSHQMAVQSVPANIIQKEEDFLEGDSSTSTSESVDSTNSTNG